MIDQDYKADLIDAPAIELPEPNAVRSTARSYAAARPVVDLCRCADERSLVKAVVKALEGLPQASARFQARAAKATGPNGLAQIAGDYVRLERSM